MTTEIVPFEQRLGALSVGDVRAQVNLIQHIMREVMKNGEHYGTIPGTGGKPTLLKPGAEKLCLVFRLAPDYQTTEQKEGDHLTVISKCTLMHIPSGQVFATGMGSCSTKESKYAYRQAARKCPVCGAEAIIKGKEEYGGGWVCFKKKHGCGTKFKNGDQAIEGQPLGRIPNEDLADQYNTVLKMSNKRALVAATLNATAASDIYTQDIEDMPAMVSKGTGNIVDADDEALKDLENAGAQSLQSASERDAPSPVASSSSAPSAPLKTRTMILQELVVPAGYTLLDVLAKAGVSHADEMTDEDFTGACAMLRRRATKRALAQSGEKITEQMQP